MAATLDDLTNDQLRLQLLKYGLANMPVTNTTRKVLTKRLRAAIEAESGEGDKPVKSRRETVHVAKISSGDESEPDKLKASEKAKGKTASNRRATINVSTVSSIPVKTNLGQATPVEAPVTKPISTRRASGRVTPVSVTNEPPVTKPISKAPQIVDVPEEEEDNSPFIPVSQKRLSRSSRSPSMSKSETVVTSFKHVQAKTQPIIEETVDISDEEADVVEIDEPETSGEFEIEQFTTPYSVGFSDKRITTGSRYETKNINRSSIATSYASSSAFQPTYTDEFKSAATQRRFTTSNWNQPTENRHRTPEKGEAGVPDVHTPYLSDFTRRLSKLRAEPLSEATILRRDSDSAIDGSEFNTNYYRTSSQVHGRLQRNSTSSDDTIWSHFMTLILSVERKYRYAFWTVVLLLLAIFFATVFLV